jgi:hypothetical protein
MESRVPIDRARSVRDHAVEVRHDRSYHKRHWNGYRHLDQEASRVHTAVSFLSALHKPPNS